mmetsp:Transcript_11055/g.15216  ORF Transcript_11055/g.15216 Transcript_11055/m.15216 type:complete len:98 (+) Transcript_11055:295-588(+)
MNQILHTNLDLMKVMTSCYGDKMVDIDKKILVREYETLVCQKSLWYQKVPMKEIEDIMQLIHLLVIDVYEDDKPLYQDELLVSQELFDPEDIQTHPN